MALPVTEIRFPLLPDHSTSSLSCRIPRAPLYTLSFLLLTISMPSYMLLRSLNYQVTSIYIYIYIYILYNYRNNYFFIN